MSEFLAPPPFYFFLVLFETGDGARYAGKVGRGMNYTTSWAIC